MRLAETHGYAQLLAMAPDRRLASTPIGLCTTSLRVAAVVALLAAACGKDSTAPSTSLVGTWDLIGFTDMGVAAVTSGTWVFRSDHTFSVNGTITFPGEPTDPLVVDGTYVQSGNRVALTIAAQTGNWTLTASGNEVTLTENEPAPANTITLRRSPFSGIAFEEPGNASVSSAAAARRSLNAVHAVAFLKAE